jgi:hypothetical protein
MYTAILAIQLYNDDLSYKELFCEHHEDILAQSLDGKFVGIQIKTQDIKYGKFKLSKTKEIIEKFINLDKKFPNQFKEFILVTNCGFDEKPENNIEHLISNIQNYAQLPIKMKNMVTEIRNKCGSDANEVRSTIKKYLQKK